MRSEILFRRAEASPGSRIHAPLANRHFTELSHRPLHVCRPLVRPECRLLKPQHGLYPPAQGCEATLGYRRKMVPALKAQHPEGAFELAPFWSGLTSPKKLLATSAELPIQTLP
jgi:hypothetical protein